MSLCLKGGPIIHVAAEILVLVWAGPHGRICKWDMRGAGIWTRIGSYQIQGLVQEPEMAGRSQVRWLARCVDEMMLMMIRGPG